MRITTTDGQDYKIADMCSYCQLSTSGNHEPHCPLYGQHRPWDFGQIKLLQGSQTLVRYIGGKVRELSYPDSIAVEKLLIDRHPEWGVRYL